MTKKKEQEKKMTLALRVKMTAENGYAEGMNESYNGLGDGEKNVHVGVCKGLVKLSETHNNYPITYLVYFAVGKNAHRTGIYQDGYSNLNVQKANIIFEMLRIFSEHHKNKKLFTNPNLAHVMCKYYDKNKNDEGEIDIKAFKALVEQDPSDPNITTFERVNKCPWYEKERELATAAAE